MPAAQGDAVADLGFSLGLRVRDDVRRVDEFVVLEAAERAVVTICVEDTLPERTLLKSPPGDRRLADRQIGGAAMRLWLCCQRPCLPKDSVQVNARRS